MGKIALITAFGEFNDTYSLCHVVADQARALELAGMEPEIWTMNGAEKSAPPDLAGVDGAGRVRGVFSRVLLEMDRLDDTTVKTIADELECALAAFSADGGEAVICHDLIYQMHYIAFAKAIHDVCGKFPDLLFFHYVHSTFNQNEALTDINRWRRRLPDGGGHFVIVPSAGMLDGAAKYFNLPAGQIFAVNNPRDMRSVYGGGQSAECRRLVGHLRLTQRDIVQVLPFCTTRMAHKGVAHTARVFEKLKTARGRDVCLICCNSSANGQREKDAIRAMRAIVPSLNDEELVFTSELGGHIGGHIGGVSELGVPNRLVSELMAYANVFAFFSMGEGCSLALAEAQAHGCICALNLNLAYDPPPPPGTIFQAFDAFGLTCTYHSKVKRTIPNADGSYGFDEVTGAAAYDLVVGQVAELIDIAIEKSVSHQTKRHAFRHYSLEAHGDRLMLVMAQAAGIVSTGGSNIGAGMGGERGGGVGERVMVEVVA